MVSLWVRKIGCFLNKITDFVSEKRAGVALVSERLYNFASFIFGRGGAPGPHDERIKQSTFFSAAFGDVAVACIGVYLLRYFLFYAEPGTDFFMRRCGGCAA